MQNQERNEAMIFNHQQSVYSELLRTACVFFSDKWRGLAIRPRFNRIIVGPTGVGKTTIVRKVAESLGIPFYAISASNWMPIGSSERSARPTWADIGTFCLGNERGIIFLDEVDKLGEQSSWFTHIRCEMFNLMDFVVPSALHLKQASGDEEVTDLEELGKRRREIEEKLRNHMLLIGAGAFQFLWENKLQAPCGFHSVEQTAKSSFTQKEMHKMIPPEVANRFSPGILVVKELERADYDQLVSQTCNDLPEDLAQRVRQLADERINDAIANRSGCRWIEDLILSALMEQIKVHPFTEHAKERAIAAPDA